MSVRNKSPCIMSKELVLRRILSNGDDRQADRPAQTLPLMRLEERPGQFLSLSVPSLPLFFSLSLHVCVSDLSQKLASHILFSKQYICMFFPMHRDHFYVRKGAGRTASA